MATGGDGTGTGGDGTGGDGSGGNGTGGTDGGVGGSGGDGSGFGGNVGSDTCFVELGVTCVPVDGSVESCMDIPTIDTECTDVPSSLTFRYDGNSCSTPSDGAIIECQDYNGGPSAVDGLVNYIVASDSASDTVYFAGPVAVGEEFIIDAGNSSIVGGIMTIRAYRSAAMTVDDLVQSVAFFSDCQTSSLSLKDTFAAIQLVAFTNAAQGEVSCFYPAKYIYTMENVGEQVEASLTGLSSITGFGVFNLDAQVASQVLAPGESFQVEQAIVLDLTVRERYSALSNVTVVSQRGVVCSDAFLSTFIAGNPKPITNSPSAAPVIGGGSSGGGGDGTGGNDNGVGGSGGDTGDTGDVGGGGGNSTGGDDNGAGSSGGDGTGGNVTDGSGGSGTGGNVNDGSGGSGTGGNGTDGSGGSGTGGNGTDGSGGSGTGGNVNDGSGGSGTGGNGTDGSGGSGTGGNVNDGSGGSGTGANGTDSIGGSGTGGGGSGGDGTGTGGDGTGGDGSGGNGTGGTDGGVGGSGGDGSGFGGNVGSDTCFVELGVTCVPVDGSVESCMDIPTIDTECTDVPSSLTFRYDGNSCSTPSDGAIIECQDYNGGPSAVDGLVNYIVASDSASDTVYFAGPVAVGEEFIIDAGNSSIVGGIMTIRAYRSAAMTVDDLVQSVAFFSDCQTSSLSLKDTFAAIQLVAFTNAAQGEVSCFYPAKYIYTMENVGEQVEASLTGLSSITGFGVFNLDAQVASQVLAPGESFQVEQAIVLDLTVRERYSALSNVTVVSQRGVVCSDAFLSTFIAGNPKPITNSPSAAPVIGGGSSGGGGDGTGGNDNGVGGSGGDTGDTGDVGGGGGNSTGGDDNGAGSSGGDGTGGNVTDGSGGSGTGGNVNDGSGGSGTGGNGTDRQRY